MNLTRTATQKARSAARKILPGGDVENCGADRGTQHLLSMAWSERPDLPFRDVEFRNNSQNGEDGILLYLFALAGHGTRRAVELCAGDGIQNNTANLVLHHDWDSLMVDGDPNLVETGRAFYRRHSETYRLGGTLTAEWVTAANVNGLLDNFGYGDDVDLLSVDMDGIDYWIISAINLRPRVIVLEYNNRIPADLSLTVPYQDDFSAEGGAWLGDGFFGASLAAFNKILSSRGYRLVGANRQNTNAFFLREDVLPSREECTVASCLTSRWAQHQLRSWHEISDRPWVAV